MSDEPLRGQGDIEHRFAERIKAIREARKWSAQYLANQLAQQGNPELTRVAISKIECFNRRISLDESVALCQALGVTIADMVSPEALRFEIKVEVII